MSTSCLPLEILDCIADLLHDEPESLRNCSLVAKSWVPRARKHLFANIEFNSPRDLQLWKQTFPNPSDSPAHYARNIRVKRVGAVAGVAEGGWIPTFPRAVCLQIDIIQTPDSKEFLVPFHRFSPVLKALRVHSATLPSSQIFDLVFSFPLLQDLTLVCLGLLSGDDDRFQVPQVIVPAILPAFTGSLKLRPAKNFAMVAPPLMNLPNGLRFRELNLSWHHEQDLRWINELASACCDTIESVEVTHLPLADPSPPSSGLINLSEATKLRNALFWTGSLAPGWIATTLKTTTARNRDLQKITISISDAEIVRIPFVEGTTGNQTYEQWLDLDRLLVRAWELHSIRSTVKWKVLKRRVPNAGRFIARLLPEVTKGGILVVVE